MQTCVILTFSWSFSINCVSNKNVSMWINHIFFLIFTVCATRIIGGPVFQCVPIQVVIDTAKISAVVEHRTITPTRRKFVRSQFIFTRVCHMFHNPATDAPFLPINQAPASWIALQPVVNVALDKDLSAKLFPQRKVYGVVVCFVQWRSCRDRNIHVWICFPIWSWCYCVRFRREITVIEESIAPN